MESTPPNHLPAIIDRQEATLLLEDVDWTELLGQLGRAGMVGACGQEFTNWHRRSTGVLYLRCVFHDERTPSLVCWPSDNFKCHGCGETGDQFDFLKTTGYLEYDPGLHHLSRGVRLARTREAQLSLGLNR